MADGNHAELYDIWLIVKARGSKNKSAQMMCVGQEKAQKHVSDTGAAEPG